MAERVSQREIDREVAARLRAIEPLLNHIGWGSDEEEYVTVGAGGGEELTARGVEVARHALRFARASVPNLYDLLHRRAVGRQDTALLDDALDFFMLVSAALQGLLSEPMLVADEDLAAAWPEVAGTTMDTKVLLWLRRWLGVLLERARPTPWGTVSAPITASDPESALRELLRQAGEPE